MTIYTPQRDHKKYRKIYEQHYGAIPLDEDGRSYDIHHLDGNNKNNDPSNLVALSIKDHYDLHYAQGDYGACLIMSKRMEVSPQEKSKMAREEALKRVKNGNHHFVGGVVQGKSSRERVKNGTHNLLGGDIQRQTQQSLVQNGTHHFLDGDLQREKTSKE